jgi:transcriptional regulator with XRE-family HTH domain
MARGTFGERLKRERELREVSAEELSKATRISPRFLDALENEDWDKLPGGVFGRGFVRTIARYLGLSEESLLAEYDAARGTPDEDTARKTEVRIPRPPNWVPAIVLIAALFVLVGLFFGSRYAWRRYQERRAHKAGITAARTPELAGPNREPADPAAPQTDSLELQLALSRPTHVRILGDGKVLVDDDLLGGSTRHFSARSQFEITASDSAAVLLELNGETMPLLGAPGSSGTMVLGRQDLRQAPVGSTQP